MKLSVLFSLLLLCQWITPSAAKGGLTSEQLLVTDEIDSMVTKANEEFQILKNLVKDALLAFEDRNTEISAKHNAEEKMLIDLIENNHDYTQFLEEEEEFHAVYSEFMDSYHSILVTIGLDVHAFVLVTKQNIARIMQFHEANPDMRASFFEDAISTLNGLIVQANDYIEDVISIGLVSPLALVIEEICLDIKGAEREMTGTEEEQFKVICAATLEMSQADEGNQAEVLYVTIEQMMLDEGASARRMLRPEEDLSRELSERTLRMRVGAAYRCRCETDTLSSDVVTRALALAEAVKVSKERMLGRKNRPSTTATTTETTTEMTASSFSDSEVSSFKMLFAKNLESNVQPMLDTPIVIEAISCEEMF